MVGRKAQRWFKKPMTDFLNAVDDYHNKREPEASRNSEKQRQS